MTHLHVCPLSQVAADLAGTDIGWVVSLLAGTQALPAFDAIAPDRRLHLPLSDITVATPDLVLAQRRHLDDLLSFAARWDRRTPLLLHCYAGVSRSTAAAFVILCALDPATPETRHAQRLRTASPTATPNRRIVELADQALDRQGRMLEAIARIGRGADCYEGTPFTLPVPTRARRDTALDVPIPQPA